MKTTHLLLKLLLCCLINTALAQGETCATAVSITPGTYAADGPSTGNGCYECSNYSHADWYSFTPTASSRIILEDLSNINSIAYIYEGNCGALIPICRVQGVSFTDFNDWSPIDEDNLYFCPGTTYYIEWTGLYQSTPFNFTLGLVPMQTDTFSASILNNEYTMLPLSAGQVTPTCLLANLGGNDIDNARVRLNIKKDGVNQLPNAVINVPTFTSTVCTNAPSGSDTAVVAFNTINFSDAADYELTYSVYLGPISSPSNTQVFRRRISVDSTMAVDDSSNGYYGYFEANTISLGQNFTLFNDDALTAITFYVKEVLTPGSVRGIVYTTDSNGEPLAEIGRTIDFMVDSSMANQYITIPILGLPIDLNGGETAFIGLSIDNNARVRIGVTGHPNPRRGYWTKQPNPSWLYTQGGGVLAIRANFGRYFSSTNSAIQILEDINVSPNPSEGNINISFVLNNTSSVRLNVVDITGKILISANSVASAGRYTQMLDLRNLANGLYTLQVITNEGNATKRIVLAK